MAVEALQHGETASDPSRTSSSDASSPPSIELGAASPKAASHTGRPRSWSRRRSARSRSRRRSSEPSPRGNRGLTTCRDAVIYRGRSSDRGGTRGLFGAIRNRRRRRRTPNHANCSGKWRRRPDLNRGWRFCRFREVPFPDGWSCFLVPGPTGFYVVFGRFCSRIVLESHRGLRLLAVVSMARLTYCRRPPPSGWRRWVPPRQSSPKSVATSASGRSNRVRTPVLPLYSRHPWASAPARASPSTSHRADRRRREYAAAVARHGAEQDAPDVMTGRVTKRGGARLDQIAIVARADSPHDLSSVGVEDSC